MSTNLGRPIVVGVDETPGSDVALRWAVEEARVRRRSVHVVTAHSWQNPPSLSIDPSLPPIAPPVVRVEQAHADALAYARDRLHRDRVSGTFTSGRAAPVLREQAESAEVLVVGSHSDVAKAVIRVGSVSGALAAHASCPVVVVRGPASPAAGGIVVGFDGSTESDRALAFAFDEASLRGLSVDVVHCWTHFDYIRPGARPLRREDRYSEIEAKLREWLSERVADYRTKYPDVAVSEHLAEGRASEELVGRSKEASLVVVGSRGHGGLPGLLMGSVSQHVLHHVGCSVVVVQDGKGHPAPNTHGTRRDESWRHVRE